jgi:hypothetical protein
MKKKKRPNDLLTWQGWLKRAAASAIFYLILHLLGWRDHLSIMSGTIPTGGSWQAGLAIIYLIAYINFVVIVPILIIGAGVLAMMQRTMKSWSL